MDYYIKSSEKEISQRKLLEYDKFAEVIRWGRSNPLRFAEEIFGLQLVDFQRWIFMNSWWRPFVLWLQCRGGGKDTLDSVLQMTKMVLIPNYKVYISCLSAGQSAESFKKLEDIAKRRIPSFKSATDVFLDEVVLPKNNPDGFTHSSVEGHKFSLYNNSELVTLSSNLETIRGKRGSVVLNECGWKDKEAMAVVENFINVDANFSTSTEKIAHIDPPQMPLQLLYASSASDVTFPFYDKYRQFAKKMIAGDPNYFVCDIDAYDIINFSTINGVRINAHLTEAQVVKAIEEDPEAADRELFNKFRKGAGQNAVISMDTIIKNSTARKPLLRNDTGKKKFVFAYDPARSYDGSVLLIAQVINDPEVGYKMRLENLVSMVDTESKKKTPLPMTEQLKIIRELMIKYNGERAPEWENIEFYIDAGSGGGGVSAVADQLMEDWVDASGVVHRGVIDPEHKQYETARKKYPNAAPIVHLLDPQGFKKIIYNALEKMAASDLIEFTEYDKKDYLMIDKDGDGEFETVPLTFEEQLSLTQMELMKHEAIYMCRYDTPSGAVTYELAKEKRSKMHDDRALRTGAHIA